MLRALDEDVRVYALGESLEAGCLAEIAADGGYRIQADGIVIGANMETYWKAYVGNVVRVITNPTTADQVIGDLPLVKVVYDGDTREGWRDWISIYRLRRID